MDIVLHTDRLLLRRPTLADAPFFLQLLNQPSWLRYIGDHAVYDLQGAADYILDGPITMLEEHGHALCVVVLKDEGLPIGLCGIVRREGLAQPDLGFAFLDAYTGQGYAREAAQASVELARGPLGLRRLQALAMPGNERSMRLLSALGFAATGEIMLEEGAAPVLLFERDL